MGIMIDPDSVGGKLRGFADAYPKFFEALNETNKTFASLNTYWSGERYKKTMGAWNNTVPELNKQLKILAQSSEILNGILKNYTTADTNPVTIPVAEVKELTICDISDDRKIRFENSILLTDLSSIKKSLENAITNANLMKTENNSADWSDAGGAIDKAKADVNSALSSIMSYIGSLSSDINTALTDTSTAYGDARSAY